MSDSELYRGVGSAIAKRRDELGMTQLAVAEKIGLVRASLANIENGRQRIMLHHLYALVDTLKLKSILDLVPATWAPSGPSPDIKLTGGALTPQEHFSVANAIASVLRNEKNRKKNLK